MSDLNEIMNSGSKLLILDLDDIQESPLNAYAKLEDSDNSMDDAMQLSLKTHDLISPIEVIRVDADDHTYEVISGNTRYRAAMKNYQNGIGDGTIKAVLAPEGLSEEQIKRRIVEANKSRRKSFEQLVFELGIYDAEYQDEHDKGDFRGSKDLYASLQMGRSERWVRNLRKKIKEEANGAAPKKKEKEEKSESEEDEYTAKKLKSGLKKVQKDVTKCIETAEALSYTLIAANLTSFLTWLDEHIDDVD